ncbi:MAG: hypothetical protein IJE08_01635 [Clostridia bacterium]|nr:hypothetical protein [Clostridia bacterium]
MRTRLVRVRRRPRGLIRAMVFLMIAMALYVRVSLPMLAGLRSEGETRGAAGERATRETALAKTGIFLVSFGGYDSVSQANVEAARYVSRGAAGYVLKKEKYYVIGAGYADEADAERACLHLSENESIKCAVIGLNAPEVRLRITAGSGQIEAFSAAEKLISESAVLLGQLSFSIDRGETSAKQAAEIVRTQLVRTEAAQRTLTDASGGKMHPVIGGYLELLADMNGRMKEIGGVADAMELSSRLKHFQIEFTVREIELMNGL